MRFVVVGLVGLAACHRTETACEQAAAVDDPQLVVGLGEDDFERAIEDGELITPEYGSQGGRHLFLAVETTGFDPGVRRPFPLEDLDVPTWHAELIGVDDGQTYAPANFGYEAMSGDPTHATLALGRFVVTGLPPEAVEQPLTLSVTGTDACGTELEGHVDLGLTGLTEYGYY